MSISEKLTTIAENEQKVYEAGAKSAEYDFWNQFQTDCAGKGYKYAFSGYGWSEVNFKPIMDIVLKNGAECVFYNTHMFPLKDMLEKNGVKFDTSKMTNMDRVFNYAMMGTNERHIIPPVGNDNVISAVNCFGVATGVRIIEKFTCSPTCAGLNNAFFRCDSLESVTFGNTIATNLVLNFSTKLTHECLLHILGQLEETSTTLTLTLGATNLAKLTDAEKAIATEKGWTLA